MGPGSVPHGEDPSRLGAAGRGRGTRGEPAGTRPDGGPAPVQGPETDPGGRARRAADWAGTGGRRLDPMGCGRDPSSAGIGPVDMEKDPAGCRRDLSALGRDLVGCGRDLAGVGRDFVCAGGVPGVREGSMGCRRHPLYVGRDPTGAGREPSGCGMGSGHILLGSRCLTWRRDGAAAVGPASGPDGAFPCAILPRFTACHQQLNGSPPLLRDFAALPRLTVPGAAQSRPPLLPPGTPRCPPARSPARLRGSSRSWLASLPASWASPNTSACPGIFHRRAEGREGGRQLKFHPSPAPRALISHASLQLSAMRRGRPGCN